MRRAIELAATVRTTTSPNPWVGAVLESPAGALFEGATDPPGRPWVVLKLAASLDGRIAAPGGSSKWITGDAARADARRLRAESDAVVVGAGTVRADDPALTVRDAPASVAERNDSRDPLRVV